MLQLRKSLQSNTVPLNTAITNRRATVGYKPDPVPDEVLQELLELALLAPSGYNLQPWRFVVVRDEQNRKKLRAAAMDQPKVEEAPVVLICCADPTGWKNDLDDVFELGKQTGSMPSDEVAEKIRSAATSYLNSVDNIVWATKQTMIAFTHLMLLAECYGLDTAPMEGFYEDKVKQAFDIPEHLLVLALLAIGYAGKPDRKFGGRFDMSKIVSSEKFGMPFKG
jgi:nitroreductase